MDWKENSAHRAAGTCILSSPKNLSLCFVFRDVVVHKSSIVVTHVLAHFIWSTSKISAPSPRILNRWWPNHASTLRSLYIQWRLHVQTVDKFIKPSLSSIKRDVFNFKECWGIPRLRRNETAPIRFNRLTLRRRWCSCRRCTNALQMKLYRSA